MPINIELEIEYLEENGKQYFIATSKQIEGLVVEGETLEETVALAKEVAEDLIKLKSEMIKKVITANTKIKISYPKKFTFPLMKNF